MLAAKEEALFSPDLFMEGTQSWCGSPSSCCVWVGKFSALCRCTTASFLRTWTGRTSSEREQAGQAHKAAMCILWLHDFLQCRGSFLSPTLKREKRMWTEKLILLSSTFSLGPRFLQHKSQCSEIQKSFSTILWHHDPLRQESITE